MYNPNTVEALLTIHCYFCNKLTENCEPIIIRKTGRKLFRIETNCSHCQKRKVKCFVIPF